MFNNDTCSRLRYAILEAIRINSERERFIIAYRTESSLHEFLVGSCIVASGYSSREEAVCDRLVDALAAA